MIADDYLKSSHVDVSLSAVVSALHARFRNNTEIVSIEYIKADDGTYYRGNMEVDLESFIFREVGFAKIAKSDLRPLNTFKINYGSAPSKKKIVLDTSKLVGNIKDKGDCIEK